MEWTQSEFKILSRGIIFDLIGSDFLELLARRNKGLNKMGGQILLIGQRSG